MNQLIVEALVPFYDEKDIKTSCKTERVMFWSLTSVLQQTRRFVYLNGEEI